MSHWKEKKEQIRYQSQRQEPLLLAWIDKNKSQVRSSFLSKFSKSVILRSVPFFLVCRQQRENKDDPDWHDVTTLAYV